MPRFDVFGRPMLVERTVTGWEVYLPGSDGKRRRAADLLIPPSVAEAELATYLADLCHELATPQHPEVRRLG